MGSDVKTNLRQESHTDSVDEVIDDIYDCKENPLSYMIEPKITVDIVDKDTKTTTKDLEHILD